MITKIYSEPPTFHKVIFALKPFQLYFVICYLKNLNQDNHIFVSLFVSYFIDGLDGVMTTWLSLENTFSKSSSLCGFSDSWRNGNMQIWSKRRRTSYSQKVAAVSHVDGQVWYAWWAPSPLFCTFWPTQLLYCWCWSTTAAQGWPLEAVL